MIKIYTTPSSPWSNKLKAWLKTNKIKFEDLDVTEEKVYRDEILEKTNQMATPVIEIGDEIIIGFHENKIKAALEKVKN